MILLMRQIAVAVELQASTTVTVHRIRRPVDIVAELVIIFPVGLHVQIVAVARHILDDQVTTVDGTGGMRLLEFPIGHHIQWGTFTFKRAAETTVPGAANTASAMHATAGLMILRIFPICMTRLSLALSYFNDDANVPLQCAYASWPLQGYPPLFGDDG